MQILTWNDILEAMDSGSEIPIFSAGTGISVGSFDGVHLGHRKLISELVDSCRAKNLRPGVVSFSRPLPGIKHSGDYMGDLTTLAQRLEIFESLGISFAVIVDFDDSFASLMGTDFLNILLNITGMRLIAEGFDFRCGYKGATDTQAIKYWADSRNVECVFVEPVYYRDGAGGEERVSSSYIRGMIQRGFFTTASELLARPYRLDISTLRKNGFTGQILPPDGIYRVRSEGGDEVRLEIAGRKIAEIPDCSSLDF